LVNCELAGIAQKLHSQFFALAIHLATRHYLLFATSSNALERIVGENVGSGKWPSQ